VLELLIAVGAGVGGDLLAVDAQREMHLVEQTSDRVGRDGDADLLEDVGNPLGRFAGPLQPGDGIAGGVVFQQNLDGIDYFGRFFPRACDTPLLCARGPLPPSGTPAPALPFCSTNLIHTVTLRSTYARFVSYRTPST
jgi:hypothetical protein